MASAVERTQTIKSKTTTELLPHRRHAHYTKTRSTHSKMVPSAMLELGCRKRHSRRGIHQAEGRSRNLPHFFFRDA